eukprot:gene14836-4403_t
MVICPIPSHGSQTSHEGGGGGAREREEPRELGHGCMSQPIPWVPNEKDSLATGREKEVNFMRQTHFVEVQGLKKDIDDIKTENKGKMSTEEHQQILSTAQERHKKEMAQTVAEIEEKWRSDALKERMQ